MPQHNVTMPDGTVHTFPDGTTPEQITQALSSFSGGGGLNPLPSTGQPAPSMGDETLTKALDFMRPFVSNAVGQVTQKIPIPGIAGPVGETQGYAAADAFLQHLYPRSSGKYPASIGESFGDAEKEALLNTVTNRLMGGIFRVGSLMRNANRPEIYDLFPTTSQALEAHGAHAFSTGAKFLEDFGAPASKAAALDKSGGAGFTQALSMANRMNGRQWTTNTDPVKLAGKIKDDLENAITQAAPTKPGQAVSNQYVITSEALSHLQGGKNPFQPLDDVIQDPERLNKVLRVGQFAGSPAMNVRQDLQAYKLMRMVNDATEFSAPQQAKRINPDKLMGAWTDPEMQSSYEALFSKKQREDITDFFKNIGYTQDSVKEFSRIKQLRLLGAGVALPASLFMGNVHGAESAAATTGILLSPEVLGRILTKPHVAEILTTLAKGEMGPNTKLASRILSNALQGTTFALMDAKGGKQYVTMEKDPQTGDYKFSQDH